MKRALLLNAGVAALAVLLATTGCKRPDKGVTPIGSIEGSRIESPGPRQPLAVPPDGGGLGPGGVDSEDLEGVPQAGLDTFEGYSMDAAYFASQTVHFDFDSSVVKMGELDKVHAVGDELKLRANVKLLIDGHCDERGTEEYNRALGERRALAVREVLVGYGISGDRIRTRSWGEDKPADPSHDEIAWKKNRRAEFILLLPPEGQ